MSKETAENPALVSWDTPQDLGKIPDSDWICPVGNITLVGDMERQGTVITDKILREYAGGRPQHLELMRYPEGYDAVKVVDSQSGRTLTELTATRRYYGLGTCNCDAHDDKPTVTSVLSKAPISMGKEREIVSVNNYYDGTQTVVKPTQVDGAAAGYIGRTRTAAHITPQAHKFSIKAEAPLQAVECGFGRVAIHQNNADIGGELALWTSNGHEETGGLTVRVDAAGHVKECKAFKRGFLEMLEMRIVELGLDFRGDWADLAEAGKQAYVLDATAEVLGYDRWQVLDLSLTAQGLYAAMGRRRFDPTAMLTPRR